MSGQRPASKPREDVMLESDAQSMYHPTLSAALLSLKLSHYTPEFAPLSSKPTCTVDVGGV